MSQNPSIISVRYERQTDTTDTFNGVYEFQNGIILNKNNSWGVRVEKIIMSATIPNIFTHTEKGITTNTKLFRVSNDNITYTTVELDEGNYSISQINNAIQNIISSWMIDSSDSAFFIGINTALNKVYIVIDSTKLSVGTQFCIDFSISDIWRVFGIGESQSKIFTTDGSFGFEGNPRLNFFGDAAFIILQGVGLTSYYNGVLSRTLESLEFVGSDVNKWIFINQSQHYYPVSLPPYFKEFSVEVKSIYGNDIVTFGNGYIYISLVFKIL